MKAIVERWFRLRPGEFRKVLLAFSFAFGTAASYVVARSAAGSLFLNTTAQRTGPLKNRLSTLEGGVIWTS
jgi:hypothetical protein